MSLINNKVKAPKSCSRTRHWLSSRSWSGQYWRLLGSTPPADYNKRCLCDGAASDGNSLDVGQHCAVFVGRAQRGSDLYISPLPMGGPSSPTFSWVSFADVSVIIFFYGKGCLTFSPILLFFYPGMGRANGRGKLLWTYFLENPHYNGMMRYLLNIQWCCLRRT